MCIAWMQPGADPAAHDQPSSRFAPELPQTANPRVKGPRCPLRSSLTHTRYQGRGADFVLGRVHDPWVVPALIADVSNDASWRYAEFFTANIRNAHTRWAYARACSRFFVWCKQRGLTLGAIRPFDVPTYIEGLQQEHSAPRVKQQLAAVRMLFDWLNTVQVLPTNPAAAVRGPKPVVKSGKTPVLPALCLARPKSDDRGRLTAMTTGKQGSRPSNPRALNAVSGTVTRPGRVS
jgi:hypothetical protein